MYNGQIQYVFDSSGKYLGLSHTVQIFFYQLGCWGKEWMLLYLRNVDVILIKFIKSKYAVNHRWTWIT